MSQPTFDKLTRAELLALVGLWQPLDGWRAAIDIVRARIVAASQRHSAKQATESEAVAVYAAAGAACDTAAATVWHVPRTEQEWTHHRKAWRRYERARAARDEARERCEAAAAAAEAAWQKLEELWAEQDALWRECAKDET